MARRSLLVRGTAIAGSAAVAQVVGASGAQATTSTYTPAAYTATPVPTATQRHVLNRLGCGFSTATHADLVRAGGELAWFEQQLALSVPESAAGSAVAGYFPTLRETPSVKWQRNLSGDRAGARYAADLAGYSMLKRVYSTRQVFENMVGFWSEHLHVHASHNPGFVHRAGYDDVIRTHALGRFSDMLVAAELHPAMLLYLDNWKSVRNAANENQGRELLELHTVGRAAGYTETMVKDSAKILSGYTVDAFKSWAGFYDPTKHTTGAVQVLGFSHANSAADGKQLAVDYLRYLAAHPATAMNIARKLCRHFVADAPSTSIVTAVAKAFRDSGTDIRTTLRALVSHPDFLASRDRLVRDPIEDFVAACRVLKVSVSAPTDPQSFANAAPWIPESMMLHHWPTPEGAPLGDAAWCTGTRMLNSFRFHWNLIGGSWPTRDVTYVPKGNWLPVSTLRLDLFVDHLSRVLLGKPSDARILGAVVDATGFGPATLVTRTHPLCTWLFVRLLAVLLDSPDHLRR